MEEESLLHPDRRPEPPCVLQIPPLVYHGFKCISETEAMIINVCTEAYNRAEPDEFRLPAHGTDIPYDWARKDG